MVVFYNRIVLNSLIRWLFNGDSGCWIKGIRYVNIKVSNIYILRYQINEGI